MIMRAFTRPDTGHPATSPSHDQIGNELQSILVVDDERAIVHFLHDLLEGEGYHVQDAFDGEEAIRILGRAYPQLVITDVVMPYASGRDILRFIDTNRDETAPKLILMSAGEQPAATPDIPFIGKPFDIDDLLELVDSVFDDIPHT